MNKLIPHLVKPLFVLFCLAVAAGVMYFSFQALGYVFPGDLPSQLFGMINFDVAAMVWFFVFVSHCRSTSQYVWSAFGFALGIAGTLGLVALEVGISTGMVTALEVSKPLTYIFVGAVVGHLVLSYAFHASEPETAADISLGIEKAKITDKAQAAVEEQINKQIDQLAAPIAQKLMLGVLQDLKISAHFKDTLDLKALPVDEENAKQGEQVQPGFLSWLPPFLVNGVRKRNTNAASVPDYLHQVTPKPSPAPQGAGSDEAADLSESKKVECMNCSNMISIEPGVICKNCGWQSPGIEPVAENALHRVIDIGEPQYHPVGFRVVSEEARKPVTISKGGAGSKRKVKSDSEYDA